MATLASVTFAGWLVVRDIVLEAFEGCKDIEFAALIYLLDELLPLIFYYYEVVFRGCKFNEFLESTARLAIMFIIQRRHHYDRATVASLSDLLHEAAGQGPIHELYQVYQQHLNIFTEKKVEVFHSTLRLHITPETPPEMIQQVAHLLSSRRFYTDFVENFVPQEQHVTACQNLTELGGTAAQAIINVFIDVRRELGKSVKVGARRNGLQVSVV